ncbi:DUF1963 domain-containing protein [Gordonia malaquae]|uniref:DUF1963 domain-containing protein n=1 Tax=Gordonia malaquae TaxID=410332 RepID=UPI0030C78917
MAKWFRSDKREPEVPSIPEDLQALVDSLRVPCLEIRPSNTAPRITGSYVGGHPYWPDGSHWPNYLDQPMSFVCQVNFATMPQLAGFPSTGILQWFVGSDDLLGLTFDETAGKVGFHTRWIADSSAPSLKGVGDPTAAHLARRDGADVYYALDTDQPVGISFHDAQTIPSSSDAWVGAEETLVKWARIVGEDENDLNFVWDEYVRGTSGPFNWIWTGSSIGGEPTFTQADVRGTGNYALADDPAGRLLISIDSAEFPGWGDAGIGHLFGNPKKLESGDTASIRYSWDCL